MDSAILAQLASLPPHLKMQILQATKQQQQQQSPAAATATTDSEAPEVVDAVADALSAPLPPPPFQYTSAVSLRLSGGRLDQRFFTPVMLAHLARDGFVVLDGFTTAAATANSQAPTEADSDMASALEEARGLYASQKMAHAGMKAAVTASSDAASSAPAAWKSSSLRGDHHAWLHVGNETERAQFPALHRCVERVDALRRELNDVLRDPSADARQYSTAPAAAAAAAAAAPASSEESTGWYESRSIEIQIASYQGRGARYVAHRDAVVGSPPHRRLTAILYFSEWREPEQGGCLRIYLNKTTETAPSAEFALPYFTAAGMAATQPLPADSIFLPSTTDATSAAAAQQRPTYVDLAPLPNRLVVFASALMLHEVRPAHDLERFAMTVWMQ